MTDSQTILRYFEARRDEMVDELVELVSIETPSHDVEAISRFVERYRQELEAAGLACAEHLTPVGACLVGELPGEDPPIVLVGHSDTVWPRGTVTSRPPRIDGDKLVGPGVFDMKSGNALFLAAVRFLEDNGLRLRRRLIVFLSADEEKGSVVSHPLMDELLPRDSTVLVPEPPCPDGSLKIRRKGVGIYGLHVEGREAHAGVEPERGISAVEEIARLVLELHGWSDPRRGITVNVGAVRGGSTSNVVAGEASCEIDVRFDRPEDGEEIHRRIYALDVQHPEANIEASGGIFFPPMVPTERSRELAELAGQLAAQIGLEVGVGASGGGSDGSYLASRGMTVIDGIGVDGAGAHATSEHILVERLAPRAAFITLLILALDERSD